jgi:hypothetical protein
MTNELNVASLSASKKLVENGIVLETDAVWFHFKGGWQLLYRKGNDYIHIDLIPAPSFAEIWRELPETHKTLSGIECRLQLDKIRRNDGVIVSSAQYVYGDKDQYVVKFFANTNPVDALAELLIWVKGQEVSHDRP